MVKGVLEKNNGKCLTSMDRVHTILTVRYGTVRYGTVRYGTGRESFIM